MALGVYPDVSLKSARTDHRDAQDLLKAGIDPSAQRKAIKPTKKTAATNSFKIVALEWFSKQKPNWSETHRTNVERMMARDLFPYLGSNPLNEITPPKLLAVLRKIENRGASESAKRTK